MIVISATFVAEPLEPSLRLLLDEAGVAEQIFFAPYHQVFQELLTNGSLFSRNSDGINVLLIRLEDFFRTELGTEDVPAKIERVGEELADAIASFSRGARGSLLLAVLPPSPSVPSDLSARVEAAGEKLTTIAARLTGVHLLDPDAIRRAAGSGCFDTARDNLAHVPFADQYYAAMSLTIARRIHALRAAAAKVLVLDCDNTLWRGVVGEDGVDGIEMSAPYRAVQEFAVAQQAKGILVCLVSKNTESDVTQAFAARSDMPLNLTHIVSHRINWSAKSANIRSLAAELNLGVDAFVFIDDNPVECARVRAEVPQVLTIQLPDSPGIESMLRNLWAFDKLVVTAEDGQRTQMYRENAARRAFESSVSDLEQFMQGLALEIEIGPPTEDEWPRLEQLSQRTNQFNFTTRRRSAAELRALLENGALVMRVKVKDRFGDYGLVGTMVARIDGKILRIDTLLLSCRVLGRGVEHAMLRRLGEFAADNGLEEVSLPYLPTARNEPARAFADSIASEFAEATEEGKAYRIPVGKASMIKHRAGHDPAEVIEARLAEERKSSRAVTPDPASESRSVRFERLATTLTSGKAIVEECRRRVQRVRWLSGAAAPPETAVESQVARLWESLMGVSGVGIDDDYFMLGGTSLLSVALFAEIQRTFGVELRLTMILEAPTIRTLSRALMSAAGTTDRQGLVCLRAGNVRNVFLVHDGLGETLLYLNLAHRMAPGVAVYGIEPKRLPGISLAHASIEEMAEYYVSLIRQIQPHGPYELGGMCAGGVIAYAMAACLARQHELVSNILILDGATPQALKRKGRIIRARISRLKSTLANPGVSKSALAKCWAIVSALAHKAMSAASYESGAIINRISIKFRLAFFERAVRLQTAWPRSLPQLSVLEIYNHLEARYIPPSLPDAPVLLVRASVGDAEDTPYRDIYEEEDFGWRRVAAKLDLVDVEGGHASMLQAHHVSSLSSALAGRFG